MILTAEQFLINTEMTASVTFYISDVVTDPDWGAATVVVTDAAGAVLIASTSAMRVSTGVYSYTLAPQTDPAQLTFTWTATFSGTEQTWITHVEIVGGHYFSVAEFVALDAMSTVTPAEAADVRSIVEQLFEQYTETTWVERYRYEIADSQDYTNGIAYLSRAPFQRLLSVKLDDVAVVTTTWAVTPYGEVRLGAPIYGSTLVGQDVKWEYIYGHKVPPVDLKRAALTYARQLMLNSDGGIPDRARMMTTDIATFQLAMADANHPTGLPEVDSVLNRYRTERPVFA